MSTPEEREAAEQVVIDAANRILDGAEIAENDPSDRDIAVIHRVWLFIARTADGTSEGVPCIQVPELQNIPSPMIATNMERLAMWKRYAPQIAKALGHRIILIEFSARQEMQSWSPLAMPGD